jgi:cytochrome c oxidase cbb3-type subunit I/II
MDGSIMPNYQWILKNDYDASNIQKKMEVLRTLGAPYSDNDIANASQTLEKQAKAIVADLEANGVEKSEAYNEAYKGQKVDLSKKEIVALIAYLQRLGTDTTKKKQTAKR